MPLKFSERIKGHMLTARTIGDAHSKCLSRRIGAVIILDNTLISAGYNGPPRQVPHCNARISAGDSALIAEFTARGLEPTDTGLCPRRALGYKSGEGIHLCTAGHAERNAIVNAAREGHKIKGADMYMSCPIPCKDCLIEIINAGIARIWCLDGPAYDAETDFLLRATADILEVHRIPKDALGW